MWRGLIACIEGARTALGKFRPLVAVEYGYPSYSVYGNEPRTLFELAQSIGYVVGDLFGAVCQDVSEWEAVCDVAYWDWFLVPQERIDEWRIRLSYKEIASGHEPEIASLRVEIATLRAEIAALRASTSWRVTIPMRAVTRLFRDPSRW